MSEEHGSSTASGDSDTHEESGDSDTRGESGDSDTHEVSDDSETRVESGDSKTRVESGDSDASAASDASSAAAESASLADDLDDALDPSASEPNPSFDVTSGDDLVERLPSDSEVPAEVKREFWTAAFLLKIAVLALTGAVLLAVFRGELVAAAVLGVVGLLAASRTALKVRSFRDS